MSPKLNEELFHACNITLSNKNSKKKKKEGTFVAMALVFFLHVPRKKTINASSDKFQWSLR